MRGNPEDYALAAVGAAEGMFKYYIKPELSAKRAWLAIGLGVLAYELAAPKGELLSEGADRGLSQHPLLTRAAVGATALHLLNAVPERYDPLHRGLEFLKNSW